ncbi:MAG TPA: hypothetical protein VHZ98_14605 [Galbitalea sp.]|nr:hypothetical protein [Galbitalea sp.]
MVSPELAALLARTISRLETAGVHDESLAVWKHSRGLLGLGASDSLVPTGRAWRLGVLLVDRDGGLYSTGQVTRAVQPGRAAVNRSAAGEERRSIRAAAAHGNFPRGETINHGWAPIALDDASLASGSEPLTVRDGVVFVRFGEVEPGVLPLERYLDDRINVLLGD